MKSVIILLGMILFMMRQKTDAINCYTCGVGTDGCGSSFKKTGSGVMTGGNANVTHCLKLVATSNTNAIGRSFGFPASDVEGSITIERVAFNQYSCTTDLCNGAAMGKGGFVLAMITLFIGLLLLK